MYPGKYLLCDIRESTQGVRGATGHTDISDVMKSPLMQKSLAPVF